LDHRLRTSGPSPERKAETALGVDDSSNAERGLSSWPHSRKGLGLVSFDAGSFRQRVVVSAPDEGGCVFFFGYGVTTSSKRGSSAGS
jgi:hypothetical protein